VSLVHVERREDKVAVVTLNRPERLNALSMSLVSAVKEAFASLHRDRTVDAVVLTGAGRGFCAGADLSFDGGDPAPDSEGRGPVGIVYRSQEHIAEMILAIHECDKPVVAAVHGAAVGGGLAMALACDLRVATPTAKFGSVFINIGLSSCDVGVSYFLPRIVGPTRAAELMLTGRHFSGEEADRFGMLNRLVDPDDLLPAALDLAAAVARSTEYGRWMTQRGMWLGMDAPSLRHAIELENRTQVLGTFTGNMTEAAMAFIEKRDPDWKPL
jgi:enoyl-CoA hydratase